MLSTYYGFKIENGKLMIPISDERYKRGEYEEITLNNYVLNNISTVKVHSFILNITSLSLSIGNDPEVIEYTNTVGVDRNLKNVTVGNEDHQEIYDLSEVVTIKKRYKNKISHFRRNDRRIQKEASRKETRNTSRECSAYGSLTRKEQGRTLKCTICGIIDRDINAAINIARRGRTRLTRSLHNMEKWR